MFKKVFLTGVAGGIGRALAHEFRRLGIRVIGSDYLKPEELSVEVDDYFQIDLSQLDDIEPKLEHIHSIHPDIDLVINNAGIAHIMDFLEEGQEGFEKVMDVNFNSMVRSCRYWLKQFSGKKHKAIANMASMAGHISPSGMTSYSASKHAVIGFTESLNQEMKVLEQLVKIILITPGFIETDIMQIGKEGGFPEKLRFLVSPVDKAAKKIVKQILAGDEKIIPDNSGKFIHSVNRFIPAFINQSNTYLAKKIKKK